MRKCLLNDCDSFRTVRPCCLDCEEYETCPERCQKRETTFCVGLIEEKDNDG
mgnify:CR=1 FL=1